MSEVVASVGPTISAPDSELARNWKPLLAAALGIGLGISPIAGFTTGIFAIALQDEFKWSRGDILGVVVFQTLVFALIGPFIGRLTDRIGPRPVAIMSTIGLSLTTMAFALINAHLWTFYAVYGLMMVVSLGTMPPVYARVISLLFDRQRGVALGIALCTTGISGIILPIFVQTIIGTLGWRAAYIGLGMLPLIFALPCITFMLPRGMKTVRQEQAVAEGVAIIPGLSIGQVLRGYRYWLMAVTGFVVGVGIGGLVINFVPLLVDRGFSPLQAAQMFSAFGACVIIGRLASGWLMDRFWAPAVGCVFLLLPAVGVLLLVGTGTGYLLMVAIVFIALASGGEFDLIAYLCSRYFGTRNFSALYAGQYAIFACGAGIAPGVLGAVRDRVGTYDPALYAIAVMFAVSAVALLGMGRYTFSAAEAR